MNTTFETLAETLATLNACQSLPAPDYRETPAHSLIGVRVCVSLSRVETVAKTLAGQRDHPHIDNFYHRGPSAGYSPLLTVPA